MHIAVLTPLPPIKSGIAGYSSFLLPALAKRVEVVAVVDQPNFDAPAGIEVLQYRDFIDRRDEFDVVYCQLGNNPYHEFAYRHAMTHRSTIVLHDLVLHHLIVEITLARGDSEAYVEALRENHGAAGEAWARGRVAGLHGEIGNFLLPASIVIANRSKRVIVHNEYAAATLRHQGVATPIRVVGHPEPPVVVPEAKSESGLIGMFGFVTSAKRPEIVLEAFSRALSRRSDLRMLIVGEPAPNVDLETLAARYEIPRERWEMTGYITDPQFDAHLARVEKVVSLRYPSAGETSGALLRVFAFGKPVAVSDYAQFTELPDDVVTKIPFDREVEALEEFMIAAPRDVSAAQRSWLNAQASLDDAVAGYLASWAAEVETTTLPTGLPLFPHLELAAARRTPDGVRLAIRNLGAPLRAAVYGEPAFRLIAKLYDGDREVHSSWHTVSRDLGEGDEEEITVRHVMPDRPLLLTLFTALEGVPSADGQPFARETVP